MTGIKRTQSNQVCGGFKKFKIMRITGILKLLFEDYKDNQPGLNHGLNYFNVINRT